MRGPSCSTARGIFPDQGSSLCPVELAGGFPTTVPPGKPCISFNKGFHVRRRSSCLWTWMFSSLPTCTAPSAWFTYRRLWRAFDVLCSLPVEAGVFSVERGGFCICPVCRYHTHPQPPAGWNLKHWWEVLDFNLKRRCVSHFYPAMSWMLALFYVVMLLKMMCVVVKTFFYNGFKSAGRDLVPGWPTSQFSTSCPSIIISSALGCDDKLLVTLPVMDETLTQFAHK